jgi:hypothetical protein
MPDNPTQTETWFRNRVALKKFAEEQPLPQGFSVSATDDLQIFEITDSRTQNRTEVAIFAYKTVRRALADLFTENPSQASVDLDDK